MMRTTRKPTKPENRDGDGFIAEIIRTNRRKTADVRVEEGSVTVVVPQHTKPEKIDQILAEKRQWIRGKIALHLETAPISAKEYVSGEAFSYLGRNYRLKVEEGPFAPVKLIKGRLVVTTPHGSKQPHMIRNALTQWFKHQANNKLRVKVDRYAAVVGAHPNGVGIKSFKSRWGSCTDKGRVEFNWKIIMAPIRIVDYIVVHELCHLKQHDHSPAYWREVERVMPDYQECRKWLKENAVSFDL
jgi:hypothetical protein